VVAASGLRLEGNGPGDGSAETRGDGGAALSRRPDLVRSAIDPNETLAEKSSGQLISALFDAAKKV